MTVYVVDGNDVNGGEHSGNANDDDKQEGTFHCFLESATWHMM